MRVDEDWQETWKEKKGHAQGCFGREVEVDEAWQWDDLVDACMNAKEPKKSLISLLMHTYDTDHSGFITQAEVLEMVHSASRLGVANDTSTAQDLRDLDFDNPIREKNIDDAEGPA